MSTKLADTEDDLVLEDQTIPTKETSDEAVQLLVTVDIENGHASENGKVEQEAEKVEEVLKKSEENGDQPNVEVKEDHESPVEEVEASMETKEPEVKELPPPPPKRSSQTNQRLKKLSKMIKNNIPSIKGGGGSAKVERKSLKDRLQDSDFLKERRAVSESRFRMVDKGRSPSPTIERTRSLSVSSQEDEKKDYSVPAINIKPIIAYHERQSSPVPVSPTRSLRSPSRELKSPLMVNEVLKSKSPSPTRNTVMITPILQEDKHSTTSPESENNKSETESKKGSKKSKKEKKEAKRRRSGCETCHSDREEKKDKKNKAKKEGQKRKKVTINSDTESKKKQQPRQQPRPPQPKAEALGPPRDGFFKQLLITNELEKRAETQASVSSNIERNSRKKSKPIVHRPSFNTFLKNQKVVTESRFRRDSTSPIERANGKLVGSLQGESYFENRSRFENGDKPIATFPRSLSNLERRAASANTEASERPTSALSGKDSRASSLPRPGSAGSMDHEEYKNYVLEMIHSSQKSPRFQQLQAYYNILDRALKLEKKSSNMDVHKLKSDQVIDFETWRKMRGKEKAKDELNLLLSSLREAQRARQFHFRPKEATSVSWRGDIRLRGRDKSVENLKNHFAKIADKNGVTDHFQQKIEELNEVKDVYKVQRAAPMVDNNIKRLSSSKFQSHHTLPRSTKSSLTQHQVNHLKGQLTEIFDSRASSQQAFHVDVTKIEDVKAKLESQKLFVKPLPKRVTERPRTNGTSNVKNKAKRASWHENEIKEQKELSHKIGQEIKEKVQPRDFNNQESQDFLLVLTSPSAVNEELKASVESWVEDEALNERPKSVNELAKSFEDLPKSPRATSPPVETNISVRETKKSFEEPNPATSKKVSRTTSFQKAIESSQVEKSNSLGKLSKSTSSLENVLDEVEPPSNLSYFNEMSMSNPDISDSENATTLRAAFKKIGSQLNMSNSNPYLDPVSPLLNHYNSFGQKVEDPKKYSRAYLTLVKSGDVTSKLAKFEDPKIPRGYSQRTLNLYKNAEKTKDYVRKHATDLKKVVIKTKEVGNVSNTIQRLELKAKSPIPVASEPKDKVPDVNKTLTWTDQKAKLKHFCKKMSHSKILNKMIALQSATQTIDKGTEKLMMKSAQEEVLKSVYQGGKVESKVDMFERPTNRPQSPAPEWTTKTETAFSWSKRLNPSDSSSNAQKHNQFRKYYGYHPTEHQPMSLLDEQKSLQEIQPTSLPAYLENLPPPPPIRTNTLKGAF